jgi:group I intron endonuclease
MKCNIYVIRNSCNDKAYVGQTWMTLNDRFTIHKRPSAKGCIKLHNALNKYGRDNFSIELLVTCEDQMTADYLESFWIKTFDSIENGYNLKEGGNAGKLSNETKRKMSMAQLGHHVSDETKTKISEGHKGKKKPWSVKQGKALGILNIGRKHPHNEETKKRLSGPRVLTEDQIAEIRKSNLSLDELAVLYGVGRVTIWRYRK